ncbi:hypothetical protein SAMN05444274_10351 [Mariniphaga anaerophila]|uniref:Outer membrane protein beta-barrel domain-containing protein n=1 Tax=Mariniphaga anaerophila TaxID=1484053 RepID=A0A1M4XLQ1_9BACT|nr:hypothetical protein [Mariniphaga anaerophila]SHE94527.1 hypothetical protein SAMN05444274_10351 [Mariniphaga anaerophila]
MKTQIVITILIVFSFLQQSRSYAQESVNPGKNYNFEVALDIMPFFKESAVWDANFKYFNYKNNQLKGAYRLGVNFSYLTVPETEGINKSYHSSNGLTLGYEHYVNVKESKFYVGVDLSGYLTNQKHKPIDVNDRRIANYMITPFVGIRKQIIDCLAISFEAGWNNSFMFDKLWKTGKPSYEATESFSYQSSIDIPYSLTINYRF